MANLGVKKIDLLKVDVEGSELVSDFASPLRHRFRRIPTLRMRAMKLPVHRTQNADTEQRYDDGGKTVGLKMAPGLYHSIALDVLPRQSAK